MRLDGVKAALVVVRVVVWMCAALILDAHAQDPPEASLSCHQAPASAARIDWMRPETHADQHALERECATVGPVALHTPEVARNDEALDSLVVVSWNTHVGGADVLRLVGAVRAGEWSGGKPVSEFVLLLQEVHRQGEAVPAWRSEFDTPGRIAAAPATTRLDIVDIAAQLQLHMFYAPSMRNGGARDPQEDRGNAILSTRPLHHHAVIELPFEGQRRAAVAASVQGTSQRGEQWTLRLCSAHLDAQSGGLRVFASLGAGRARQARFLVRHLNEPATVLGGDFNTWTVGPRESSIAIVRDAFPLPLELDEQATFDRHVLRDPRVDYVFFRLAEGHDARYRRIDSRFGSDHHPLYAVVPLGTPAR